MKHENKEIVYIEYKDGKPHNVITASNENFTMTNYDFEIDCYDDDNFMFYNSGCGGLATEIQAPKYTKNAIGKVHFWLHPKASFKDLPENVTQLKEPFIVNNNQNPFINSREVYDMTYCEFCKKIVDENLCKHININNDGDFIYFNGEHL